ncbi:hypothetical protein PN498_09240 [Oscillatoria sp. CS-180]|uniref:hypothetical protein n=1 Tax=Oscillatoria sp. CS-180 TaxID=3021720 RepID=UPI00232CDBEB|nr:hypothetical protein [Oscillatoria sp. CS-180]MDB9526168.1 hypothetical protein [Oscillatoria sp. CS-180]
MSSAVQRQETPDKWVVSTLPDPWNTLSKVNTMHRYQRIPLDPSHELTGRPARKAILPEGIPEALRIPQHTGPVRSAVAILLEDELKLANRMDEHLRHDIQDAISFIEIASRQ